MLSLDPSSLPEPELGQGREVRLLFLDDDPGRAEIFLADNPGAVWVQTVVDCLAMLEQTWDEVHLDHDLGGERFVDFDRHDCGMEVVRWLCLEPRGHLKGTRFYIHSHNAGAATIMVTQMQLAGFQVEFRPFGIPNVFLAADGPPPTFASPPRGLVDWIRRLFRREAGDASGPADGAE